MTATFSPKAIAALRGIPHRTPASPVPEADLAALESDLGISLPPPYRGFLGEVADGLDVPGYPQIFSVARLRSYVARSGMRPVEPFTHSPATVQQMLDLLAAHSTHGPQLGAALAALRRAGPLDGCIPIADGNSDVVVLVVTGPSRGILFRNGHVDAPEHERLYKVTSGDVKPLDFLGWLPLWLETMVSRVDLSA